MAAIFEPVDGAQKEQDAQREYRTAMDKAMTYLGRRARSAKQMRTYLLGKGIKEDVVEKVMERLEEYGYIDDAAFARQLAESLTQSQNKGKLAVRQKFFQAGLGRDVIDAVIEEMDEGSEYEHALAWGEKLWARLEGDPKRRDKLYRRLMNKGFEYDAVRRVMNRLRDSDRERQGERCDDFDFCE